MSRGADLRTLDRLVRAKYNNPKWELYGKGTMDDAQKAVYADILAGFQNVEEGKEYIEGLDPGMVIYTARGDEIRFSLLRIILDHIQRNPRYSPWTEGGRQPGPPSKRHASISWTREDAVERRRILDSIGLPVEPYWAKPFAQLPIAFREKLAKYYARPRTPMLARRKPGERRTAFYIQFWSPKDDPEISQPYYHSGPEEGTFKDLDQALRAARQLEQQRPDAFQIDIYSQVEEWIPEEDDPRYGYWEIVEGTVKGYDMQGKIIYDETSPDFGAAPSVERDTLFAGRQRPLPREAY